MNWKQNKLLFNYISNKNYMIKKDMETNNILYISWDNFEIKCKYFLVFSVDSVDNIYWSSDNPYIDQKTKYLTNYIKINIESNKNKKYDNELINSLKKIIQSNSHVIYENEKIKFIWCLTGNYKEYKQFYIITEIIYF